MTLYQVFRALSIFFSVVRIAILVYALLSWLRPRWQAYYLLERFVTPFIMPFRRLSVWLAAKLRVPLDFSCWFAIIGLSVVNELWWWLYMLLRAL